MHILMLPNLHSVHFNDCNYVPREATPNAHFVLLHTQNSIPNTNSAPDRCDIHIHKHVLF
jgi:hypothetical protein